VGKLGTSLFVLGFAAGPVIFAPTSELIGRRSPLVIGLFGSAVFTVGAAASKDIQTLIICRFFGGVFGASPLCVVPVSEVFTNTKMGAACEKQPIDS
jgi:MFS transporter, DHA1 family, multidrug resistance protein